MRRRRLAYVLVWAVATAVAAGGSWLGIQSIIGAAAPQRTGPLSAADLRAAAPPTIGPPTPWPSPSSSPSPSPSPSPSSASPTPTPSKSSVGTPSPSPTPSSSAWRDTGGGVFRRDFAVQGGDAVITVSASQIVVVSATPKPGFALDQDTAPSSARVTFENAGHTSSIWVTWRKNAPYAEITETV